MEKLNTYRHYIKQLLSEYASHRSSDNEVDTELIFDTDRPCIRGMRIRLPQQRSNVSRSLLILGSLGISLWLGSCSRWFRPVAPPEPREGQTEELVFTDISLEQVNPEGQKIWELEADRVVYTGDTHLALVDNPSGLLFEEGKATYRVSATKGEVDESKPEIILRGAVVLEALEDQGLVKGDLLTWKPDEEIFILEGNLEGTYAAVKFSAQRAELQNKIEDLLVSGSVVADLPSSQVRLKTEALTWDMDQELVKGIVPVLLEHYQSDNPDVILDRGTGDGILALITPQRFTLSPNAIVNLGEQGLEIRSQNLTWDAIVNRVDSPGAVTVIRSSDQLEVQGNSGAFELNGQVATLAGNVQAWNPKQAARLWSDRLVWRLQDDQVEATGAVRYEQGNPVLNIQGDRAVGLLGSEQITVTSETRSVKTVYVLP